MSYKRISPIPIAEGGTNALMVTDVNGVIYYDGVRLVSTTVGSNDQVLTSNGVGLPPTFQTKSFSVDWSVITVNQAAVAGNGYICNKGSTLVLTLPVTSTAGDLIEVTGINTALGWQIAQNANQQIFFGTAPTTVGVTGSLTSSAIRDSIKIVCVVGGASSNWNVISSIGNITVA